MKMDQERNMFCKMDVYFKLFSYIWYAECVFITT